MDKIRFWLYKTWLSLTGIREGLKFIQLFSGYDNSGRESKVSISVIKKIRFERFGKRFDIWIDLQHYGYDITEENHVSGIYSSGSYEVWRVRDILKCQPCFKRLFRKVDIKKEPMEFYETEKTIKMFQ